MANVCSKCSTENADGALACRHCGAALTPPAGWSRSLIPEDDTFDPLSAPTLVMQHTAPAQLPEVESMQPPPPAGSTGRRLVWGLASFVVLLAAGVWLLRPGAEPAVVVAMAPPAPASATALASGGSAAEPSASAASTASAAVVAVALAQAPSTPASPPSAPSVAEPASAAGLPAAAPASAPERRKRIPEPVIRRPVPAPVPAAPASEPAAAPASAPATPASAAEPPRTRTVAELCAGNSLLTRGFCEHRECGKAEHAGDPVCVRIKETEQARRLRQ